MSLIGSLASRQDAAAKVTGRAVYGMDLAAPGMLHAKVLRSPLPHALVRGIRTESALAVPGVRAVLTARDTPATRYGVVVRDQTILAQERVRYCGEAVALVAADSLEAAEEAAQAVEVDYEELPSLLDPEESLADGAPLLHPDWRSYEDGGTVERSGNMLARTTITGGDAEQAFDSSDLVVEDDFQTHVVNQCPVEPHAALAQWEPDGLLVVRTSTQFPFGIRATLCRLFGLPVTRVRVIASVVGGGFGAKLDVGPEPFVALLARQTGRPVKLLYERREEFEAGQPRHAFRIQVRSAVRRDGTILGREVKAVLDGGAYSGDTPVLVSVAAMHGTGPYRIPNFRIESRAAYTNKQNFGAYRGPTGPQMIFAIESHMDHVADRVGLDPLELRRRHLWVEGDLALNGQRLEGVGLGEALERAAEAIEWGKPSAPNRGKGIACMWWMTTTGSSAAHLEMNEDGTLSLLCGGTEIGTGAVAAGLPLIAAEELGLRPDQVHVVSGDTGATPYDFGSQGSRTLYNLGNAVRLAAREVRDQLLERAAERLEAHRDDLELGEGAVSVRGAPTRTVALSELCAESLWSGGPILGKGSFLAPGAEYDTSCVTGSLVASFNSPTFAAHAAEVEVDPDTGAVRVVKYAAAHDVGRAINPRYIRGQIQGGVTQGIGFTLLEEEVFDQGRLLTTDFTSYRIPGVLDTLPVECILVEHPSPSGPYGAKGVGEPPVVAPGAAISNAVSRVVGRRLRRLPLTPSRVLDALSGEAGEEG